MDLSKMENLPQIAGHEAFRVPPTIFKHVKYGNAKPKPRIIVTGFIKADGKPIRFKSVERAERHIRNIGKALD